jgi:hypothetical protein
VKQVQVYMSLLMAFLLLNGMGLEGCGAKEAPAAAPVQQQSTSAPAQDPPSAPQQAGATSGDQNSAQGQAQAPVQLPEVNLTADGLDELLAPVALYPDPVVAVLLQASVNPQEVMDGGNWLALDANQNLKEAALDQASQKAGFTPVMQALLHYPTVVDMMCTQFDWTKQLGAAYQGNPKAVLESVQRLRAQAVDTGALKSSPQMKVDIKQDQGAQVVELKPADPKVVYVPQYNPEQVFSTSTTTTTSGGTTTTTTTTSGTPPPSTSSTVVVQQQQQSSGVSTGTAVLIGLLSFGAGIAVGAAISNNNYYYPAWGHGGVWYGPRPYYPPPYRPVYYGGWGGGYAYHRPPYYAHNNVNININNNYYNRFNNNNNLNPGYKPRPVPYNKNPNGAYAKNMGNTPGGNKGVNYRPANTGQGNYQGNRPGNNGNNARPSTGNVQTRPGGANAGNNPGTAQRPSTGNNANNWTGQRTYQGNKNGQAGNNMQGRPSTQPGGANAGANNRMGGGNAPARNPSADRGFGQPGGTRPNTGNSQMARPSTGNGSASRPSTQPASRPTTQPAARPAPQAQNRSQPSHSGAFGGASNPKGDRAASTRGQASMDHASRPSGGGRKK